LTPKAGTSSGDSGARTGGDKWAVSGDAGPPLKFVDRKTGHTVKLAMVDKETGNASGRKICCRKKAPVPMSWSAGVDIFQEIGVCETGFWF